MPKNIYFYPLIEDINFNYSARALTLLAAAQIAFPKSLILRLPLKGKWGGGEEGGVNRDSASGDLHSSKYGTFYLLRDLLAFERKRFAFRKFAKNSGTATTTSSNRLIPRVLPLFLPIYKGNNLGTRLLNSLGSMGFHHQSEMSIWMTI